MARPAPRRTAPQVLHPGYPLETERLLLRPFTDDDLDALYDIHRRPDVTRYLLWGPRTRDDVRAMIAKRSRLTKLEDEGDGLFLAIVVRESGALIGEIALQYVSREHRQGEIGFVIHPDHQGRGYASEASRLFLKLGFEDLGLHRIIGRCDGLNLASARLMERLGMRREAHFVENELIKGEWSDELIYAMLAREWRDTFAIP